MVWDMSIGALNVNFGISKMGEHLEILMRRALKRTCLFEAYC